jgi:uncharacterized repeat protein (TIGR03809 family)
MPVAHRFETIAPKWRALAERRLSYYEDMYSSGRWRHYYTEERFLMRLRDVVRAVRLWRELCGEPPAEPDSLRPAA